MKSKILLLFIAFVFFGQGNAQDWTTNNFKYGELYEGYIVKADGSVVMPGTSWSRFGSPRQRLSPGDSIVVPIDGTYKDKITQWRDVTQILYQSAITVAAVIAL